MVKKLNIFMLMILIVGQTILTPFASAGVVFAEGSEKDSELDENNLDSGEPKQKEPEKEEKAPTEEKKVNKNDLDTLLQDVKKYEADDYTDESFNSFVDAVTAGKQVFDNADTTQEDVNEAVNKIEKAVSALQKKEPEPEEEGDNDGSAEPEQEVVEEDDKPQTQATSNSAQALAAENSKESYIEEIELTDAEHVKDFSFKVKGNDFIEGETKVSNEDSFELKVDFKTLESDAMNFGPGTVLKYQLPADFTTHFKGLTVPTRFGEIGSLQIHATDGYVTITLNDNIKEGPTIKDIEEGTFTISGNFSETNDDWDKEVNMPKGEKFKVNFVPKSGNGVTINKENGQPNKEGQKSNEIEWKVTVNTNLANTADNPVFTDKLSANVTGHKYDQGSVKIREIDVRPNGNQTVGEIAQGVSASFNPDNTEMTINLEKGKAYQITYTTIPENPGINENVTYNNEANYGGITVKKNAYVDFGKAIEKTTSGPNSDLETEWTIKYNYNEQKIPNGTTVTDVWTTSGSSQSDTKQILIDGNDGITIEGVDGGPSLAQGDYTVIYKEAEQKFELRFNTEFDYPINIKYKTKPNDDLKVSENFKVKNNVEHGFIPGAEDSKTVDYNQTAFTLVKNAPGNLNYEEKTMSWSITANQAKYPLNAGTKFEDTFGNANMILVEDSLTVKVGGQELVKGTGYNLTNNDENGFVIELVNGTSEIVDITYKTSFEQIKGTIDENRKQNYPNKVKLTDSGLPTEPEHSATHNSNSNQQNNGSKLGTYNYETKEFTWKITFNYNSNTLTNAILKDVLPAEHEITEVTLEKGSIDSGGTFVADADQSGVTQPDILDEHEFSHSLGQINQPYRLIYKTKMKDDVLPVDGGNNYSVKNKAELFDGSTPNAKWESTVTVNHSNKVLDQKNGRQVNGTETIAWDFLYNTAQSKLTNVKITDTFGLDNGTPNQLLDEDSLKVYKVTYTSNGTINKKGEELSKGTDYDVSFNTEDGATFVLEFDELDHGIYVEYESVFIGIKDSPISNELAVTYNDGENQVGSSDVPNLNFTYGAFATTSAGEFVIIKTDEATGEPMEGVEFTLKRGTRTLISGTTDENGVLDFGMPFATGTYSLEEVTPSGYESLNNFTFTLKADGGPFKGKQVVNVTNTPENVNICDDFTLTVKDVNGDPRENVKVKYVNTITGEEVEVTNATNSDGKVKVDREDLPAGTYEVVEVDNNGDKIDDLGEVKVQYNEDNCEASVQPENTCPNFTITVKDENNNPRQNIEVTVKDDNGDKVAEGTTDSDGKLIIGRDDLPNAGTYDVYEGEVYLGEVKVDYNVGCQAEVDPTVDGVGMCPNFILEIQERNGTPRADVENITIEDADGNPVTYEDASGDKINAFKTDNNGQIELPFVMKPGTYTVYEDGKRINSFEAGTDCKAEVKPRSSGGGGGWTPPPTPTTCDNFTITVKEDGTPVKADVELTLKSGTTEVTVTTDSDGKVVIDKADLPEGSYTAYDKDGKEVGTITVTYEENKCNDEIDITAPGKTCEDFTVTIKEDGTPVTSGEYTFTSEDGQTTVTGTVDSNGKVTFDRDDLPEGKYTVTDKDGTNVGSITVDYTKDNCETELNITTSKVCEDYTITILEDGTPVTSGEYTFTSEDGLTTITASVDSDGKIVFDRDDLPEGKYTVTDKDGNKSSITVNYTKDFCEDTVDMTKPEEDEEDPKEEDPIEDPKEENGDDKPTNGDDPSNKGEDEEDDSGIKGSTDSDDDKGSQDSDSTGLKGSEASQTGGISLGAGQDGTDGDGKKLPKTATNIYNLALIGFGLLVLGIWIVLYRRKQHN